jgi:soluble lytic murein transglycosylase-like protein
MNASEKVTVGLRSLASVIARGFFEITHSSFALIGLTVIFAAIALTAQPALRQEGEVKLFSWLQTRQVEVTGLPTEVEAIERATASNPRDLPKRQAAVAFWLSKKYSVAPEPISALVSEAYQIGQRTKIDPTLILAVMAIESGFNPFAQSHVGAQGLMQVMTTIHSEKYDNFGGKFAAFDPVSNLRVGVKVLEDCIKRAGSIQGGLRYYVGAANLDNDGGYAAKVMAEYARLELIATGRIIQQVAPPPSPAPVLVNDTPSETSTPLNS